MALITDTVLTILLTVWSLSWDVFSHASIGPLGFGIYSSFIKVDQLVVLALCVIHDSSAMLLIMVVIGFLPGHTLLVSCVHSYVILYANQVIPFVPPSIPGSSDADASTILTGLAAYYDQLHT